MNAVEIEEAISELAAAPFDAGEFPFVFLTAFGNKDTTIKRLKSGSSNASDVDGGVLQSREIHLATCAPGKTTETLTALRDSPKTAQRKVKFILATDGDYIEAEELATGEARYFQFQDLAKQFGFFLPLAGISTTKEIKNAEIDIKATGRLNKLYLALIEENEDWGTEARRHDLNQFMARVVFCFFAEDTGIFHGENLFTRTVEQMSDSRSGNTHEVIAELFRAMDTKLEERANKKIKSWADVFPYVNGGLFDGTKDVPHFNRNARNFLLHAGKLDWKRINPDIFGSMIQAVADDEERGSLGMHYTSVPNILKVLNPLFLDDLREALEKADTVRKLKALRRRIASIRVFDPACGSGNFLVVAYIHMREIEWEIVTRLRKLQNDPDKDEPNSWIKLENFYGIDIKDFAVETAKLALLIAEFQMNVRLIGEVEARLQVLPLNKTGQIHCGNALRMDWLEVCPPARPAEATRSDLFDDVAEQSEIDFDAKDVETYICGNPPYKGSREQTSEQKKDLKGLFDGRISSWKSLDYVSGWFLKGANYVSNANAISAFVSTNSICQGQHVPTLWPLLFGLGVEIIFAHNSFKWSNLASHNAGVTVAIVGLAKDSPRAALLYSLGRNDEVNVKKAGNINAYLIDGQNLFVEKRTRALSSVAEMKYGNYPGDGNFLTLSLTERAEILDRRPELSRLVRPVFGAQEFLKGLSRFCLWIDDDDLDLALSEPAIAERIDGVRRTRVKSRDASLNKIAGRPHQYRDRNEACEQLVLLPTVSSEQREYFPADLKTASALTTNQAFAIYDAPLWNMALAVSQLHLVWIATVCGKMKTDFRYSNTLGWNTFPVPKLTEKNKADLTACAEDILLAREAHFPATIADLYDPEKMPENLRRAHDRNDETLERIYIGRRFRNDTERLEKLFELYTKMTADKKSA